MEAPSVHCLDAQPRKLRLVMEDALLANVSNRSHLGTRFPHRFTRRNCESWVHRDGTDRNLAVLLEVAAASAHAVARIAVPLSVDAVAADNTELALVKVVDLDLRARLRNSRGSNGHSREGSKDENNSLHCCV